MRAARWLGLEKLADFSLYSVSADQGTHIWGFRSAVVTETRHVAVTSFAQASRKARARGGGPPATEQGLVVMGRPPC
jgi:hypothetical protein